MSEPTLVHGGALDHMRVLFPDAPEPWIDLSTGINPWPYAFADIPDDAFRRLPEATLFDACRSAMARAFGAPHHAVLPTPGSEALIRLLPSLLSVKSVAVLAPSYGDHAMAWANSGADVKLVADPLTRAGEMDAIVLCSPNNPNGRVFEPDALEAARIAQANRGGWLIVDEAFADLKPRFSIAAHAGAPGLIVLRSFGKFYGLAGLRLAALLAPADLLAATQMRLGGWAVSGPALVIGARSYDDVEWASAARTQLARARETLDSCLARAGLIVNGGTDLFRFVEVPSAETIWRRLGESGVAVRRFAWSETHLRIGLPANDTALARLERAFRR
jgi:cobalamin biosynthetic protein CobC